MPTWSCPLSRPEVIARSTVAGFLPWSIFIVPSSVSSPIAKVYLSPLTVHLMDSNTSPGSAWPPWVQPVATQLPSSFFTSSLSSLARSVGAAMDATTPASNTASGGNHFITHLRNCRAIPHLNRGSAVTASAGADSAQRDRLLHQRPVLPSAPRVGYTPPEVYLPMLTLARYSIGVGDRFAHQAKPQLRACMMALERGAEVIPVWNKSNREHTIIGSEPADTRAAADAAVRELDWTRPYHLDADHIRLDTVDRFLAPCDFFTIDVADSIGRPAEPAAVAAFLNRHPDLIGRIQVPGIAQPYSISRATVERIAGP